MTSDWVIRRISYLRYVGEEDPAEDYLALFRSFFLETSRIHPLQLTLSYHIEPEQEPPVALYLAVNMGPDKRGEAEDFLRYIEQFFNIIHLDPVASDSERIVNPEKNLPELARGSIASRPGLLLLPDLPAHRQDLLEMTENLSWLKEECQLQFHLRTLARKESGKMVPALHAIGALNALRAPLRKGPLQAFTPLGLADSQDDETRLLDNMRQALFLFDLEVHSKTPLSARAISIIRQGLGQAGLGDLLTFEREPPKAERSEPTSAKEETPLGLSARLVHASNLPLLVQLPVADRFCSHFHVENPPVLPTPLGVSRQGIKVAEVDFYKGTRSLRIPEEDLARHAYLLGKTGTGKTTMLKTMIASTIEQANQAVFVIDPHGDLSADILNWLPAEHADRVVYVDFSNPDALPGINLLEADTAREREFAIGELDSMFLDLYGPEMWGPRLQDVFRNLAALLSLDPEGPGTILDLLWAADLGNDNVRKHFEKVAENASGYSVTLKLFLDQITRKSYGDGSLQELTAYYRAKFSPFVDNHALRCVLGQQRSTLNFQELARDKRICIFNLSKGKIAIRYGNLIGRVLTIRILQAALANVRLPPQQRPPMMLFLDEFQNFVSSTLSDILSEARKYNLRLVLANQYLSQLATSRGGQGGKGPDMLGAVLGNVGSFLCFRVSGTDADQLVKEFGGSVDALQLASLPNWHAVCRVSRNKVSLSPFVCRTSLLDQSNSADLAAKIEARSSREVCLPQQEIDRAIRERVGRRLGISLVPEDPEQAILDSFT